MSDTSGTLMVCPHVFDGFKQDDVVCQLDTDQGKLNVATCPACITEVLNGNMETWGKYKTVTREQAATLGIVIAEPSNQANRAAS